MLRNSGRVSKSNKHKKVKYGALSKSQKEYVMEYGEMESEMSGQVPDADYNPYQKVIREEDLDDIDSRLDGENTEINSDGEDLDFGENHAAFEPKMAAYDTLLQSLRKTHRQNGFWDKREISEVHLTRTDEEYSSDQDSSIESELSGDNTDQDELSEAEEDEQDNPFVKHFGKSSELVDGLRDRSYRSLRYKSDVSILGSKSIIESYKEESSQKNLPIKSINSKFIKKRLAEPWQKMHGNSELNNQRAQMLSWMFNYRDLYLENHNNCDIMDLLALHALNHSFKTRDNILKNTERLKKMEESDQEIRDQGFTRPRVLILLPFKNDAFLFIEKLIKLSGTTQQDNKKRFKQEFTLPADEDVVDPKKPQDYKDTFAGNIDDCFRVGIKITRKNMKLYSEFYSSDIIVASPLGLRMIIGSTGDSKQDYDFLSSIEVVIVDKSHVMNLQNWDHVKHVFQYLNKIPREMRDTDFSRVRNWNLNDQASSMRQTIILSNYVFPELNTLWNKNCNNVNGKIRTKASYDGSIGQVISSTQQVFNRIEVQSFRDLDDERFTYFTQNTMPALNQSITSQKGILLVVSSYFDFLRVKRWLSEQEDIKFDALSEYTNPSQVPRIRSRFFHGEIKFLLMTERFHFFRRYRIRGIEQVVFYAPVNNSKFYAEFCNMIESEDSSTIQLFTKYDALSLERIVGTKRCTRMLSSQKSLFMFCLGNK